MSIRLSKLSKYSIYGFISLAWISGCLFFSLKTWFVISGEFGDVRHPWQYPVLQFHGFIAFLMMIGYGAMLATHIRPAWRMKPKKKSGLALAILFGCSIISAYLLYYLSSESLRVIIEYVHFAVGFSIPFLLITHLISIHQKRKARRLKR